MSLFNTSSVILYTVSPVLIIVTTELTLLVLRLFGYLFYEETGMGKTSIISNLSKGFYTSLVDNDPSGIIIGWGYVGYIARFVEHNRGVNEPTYKIKIICSPKMWESLNKASLPGSYNIKITKYDGFRQIPIPMQAKKPHKNQKKIIDDIMKIYEEKKRVSVLIHGEPGTGKTNIALLLAQQIEKSILFQDLDLFNLTNLRGLSNVRNKLGLEAPLIVLVDEFDTLVINTTHDVATGKSVSKLVDKKNTNRLFDEINNGFVHNVLLILTTNKTPEFFNEIDTSIIRKGRVDLVCNLQKSEDEKSKKFRSRKG